MAKQFGLIIPGKQKQAVVQRKTIFDEDAALEEDEEEDAFQPMVPKPSAIPSKVKKETKLAIDKALEEDPNVFDYDGVYDQLKEAETSKKKDLRPKYMGNLLKNAEIRKRDQERREEKKIQKEREEEGDEFKDKEAFITSAYKEKLEELRQTEERERREKEVEEMFDVKKLADMSGFHRHLLNQHIGEEAVPEISREKYDPPEAIFKARKGKNQNLRTRREENDDQDEEEVEPETEKEIGEEKEVEKEIGGESEPKEDAKTAEDQSKTISVSDSQPEQPGGSRVKEEEKEPETQVDEVLVVPLKEPVDRKKLVEELFTKRTVGEKYEEAVRRYQERKALRGK